MKTASMKFVLSLLMVAVLSASLAACGKRAAPVAPKDEPNTYPRTYPSDNN